MRRVDDLTKKQVELFTFMEEFFKKQGYMPTLREMQEHFGDKSVSTVAKKVDILVDKGYLKRNDRSDRNLAFNKDVILIEELRKKRERIPPKDRKTIDKAIDILKDVQ